MTTFKDWFAQVTGHPPFDYQQRLATNAVLPQCVHVPTGAGKTAAIILGWLWRRQHADPTTRDQTPRRLVFCLPMRTLVEQTYGVIAGWLAEANLTEVVGLHLLMGGAVDQRWEATPEKDCILVGTQDQLLSRALNRGYSMSRYRWPIHFALLNNDCLWVMDEVQLMGAGLATTAQLQGFRQKWHSYGPTHSLWMSATLDPTALETVDHKTEITPGQTLALSDSDRQNPILKQRLEAGKPLAKAQTTWTEKGKLADYAKALAAEICDAHQPDSLTLVICNRVDRAQAIYAALTKAAEVPLLIHSRFRPAERQQLTQQLQSSGLTGIMVATQAVEAGVDISARLMFTELAPWSSLVQRFGRCNRTGKETSAQVYWIDCADLQAGSDRKAATAAARPYTPEDLQTAYKALISLTDVGPDCLKEVEIPLAEIESLLPRQSDLLQLFDTTADLAGHDIDVSPFIRDSDDSDVAIAWRTWEGSAPPTNSAKLHQQELCRVNVGRAKDLLKKAQNNHRRAYRWDSHQGQWQAVELSQVYPGMTLLLHCKAGGYSETLGYTGNPKDLPNPVPDLPQLQTQDDDSDTLSQVGQFISLPQHSQDVADEVEKLTKDLEAILASSEDTEGQLTGDQLTGDQLIELLIKAGRWHDAGKAHPYFQSMLTHNRPKQKQAATLWAKSDHNYRDANRNSEDRFPFRPDRRGFRHELVSALLALAEKQPFLLAYLVACHHGKVRLVIKPRPREIPPKAENGETRQEPPLYALGVHGGDQVPEALPKINLGEKVEIPQQHLDLSCMQLGSQSGVHSWANQAADLLEDYGPFRLAFLEMLIRIADWRASALYDSTVLEVTDGD